MQPGLSVLDIGCGTGAITSGIAKMVGPQGLVVGLDRDAALQEIARREHGHSPRLQFELGDAISLSLQYAIRYCDLSQNPSTDRENILTRCDRLRLAVL